MDSFARTLISVLALAAAALGAACSSGVVVSGSAPAVADASGPGGKAAARPGQDKVDWNEFWKEMATRGAQ
jgi:hypothetical protein